MLSERLAAAIRLLNITILAVLVFGLWCWNAEEARASSWSARSSIVAIAHAQIGKPYTMDLDRRLGPNYFDCSGLVWYCYTNSDVRLDNTLADWIAYPIDPREALPGDLMYMGYETRPGYALPTGYHVGIYVGEGYVIHASGSLGSVVKEPVWARNWTWYGRVLPENWPTGDTSLVGDFNGDNKDDIAIFRRGSYPNWFFRLSTGTSFSEEESYLSWGNPVGDTPVVGDFNGDNKDDIAIFRRGSYPNWLFRLSEGGSFAAQTSELSWGNPVGDTPVVGDFNGDNKDDIGINRYGSYPNLFFLMANSAGTDFTDPSTTWSLSWGYSTGDTSLVGDFNGDNKDDIAIFRRGSYPNWFFKLSTGTSFSEKESYLSWGNPLGDNTLAADFNGDNKDDIAIFRRGSYPNWLFKLSEGGSFAAQTSELSWGNLSGDKPLFGNFDGSLGEDIVINRFGSYPNWFFRISSGLIESDAVWVLSWGNSGGETPY